MPAATGQSEKVRENRLRAMAERQGLSLHKSRRRDPRAMDFDRWMIVDAFTNSIVAGELNTPRALSLDEVEEWLTTDHDTHPLTIHVPQGRIPGVRRTRGPASRVEDLEQVQRELHDKQPGAPPRKKGRRNGT